MLENFPFDSLTFTVVENKVPGGGNEKNILVSLIISMHVIRNRDIDNNFVQLFNALSLEGFPRGEFTGGNYGYNNLEYTWILPISLASFLYTKFEGNTKCDIRNLKYYLDKVKT